MHIYTSSTEYVLVHICVGMHSKYIKFIQSLKCSKLKTCDWQYFIFHLCDTELPAGTFPLSETDKGCTIL